MFLMSSTFKVSELIASRPPEARRIIYSAFEKQDCRECGKCCKEGVSLTVFKSEQNFVQLRRKAEAFASLKQASVTKMPIGMTLSFPDDSCAFLTDGNSCSVYDQRPLLCRLFPFTIFDSGDVKYVALTSLCPPLAQLRQNGVNFLYYSDVSRPVKEILRELGEFPSSVQEMALRLKGKGIVEGVLGIPLLFESMKYITETLEKFTRHLSTPAIVLRDEARDELFFPIF
jgi:Fe-S-cluster containining protein